MPFLIKSGEMYFKQIKNYEHVLGYLATGHPKRTIEYTANQHEAKKFKHYDVARKFQKDNNITGTLTFVKTKEKPVNINLKYVDTTSSHDYDEELIKARDNIEAMIACSQNNFNHMSKEILKVTVKTLNKFLKNPYDLQSVTRNKVMTNLKEYFGKVGM